MFEFLLHYVALILDAGNIIFFVANLPQLVTAYRNRQNLRGLSSKMLIGFILSTVMFILAGLVLGGALTVILGVFNVLFFAAQLYWKRKYNE